MGGVGDRFRSPCDTSPTVLIGSENLTVQTDLSIPEVLRQGQAEVPCPTLIGDGLGLVGGRGDVDLVTHCGSLG